MKENRKFLLQLLSIFSISVIVMSVWLVVVSSELKNDPNFLEITAQNQGYMRVADAPGEELGEPFEIIFDYSREVKSIDGNTVMLSTIYDYQDAHTRDSMWILELDERVEKSTRKFIDNDGYSMFPIDVQKKPYSVFDVGGGTPMDMHFDGIEIINGLEVYRFIGSQILEVSDVYPELAPRIIYEDYALTTWIDPVTGLEVKFEEDFSDYYIDDEKVVLMTVNDLTPVHVTKILVDSATSKKSLFLFYDFVIPTSFVLSNQIFPFMASVIPLQMDKPSPVPPCSRVLLVST